jgi:hypothetical protein
MARSNDPDGQRLAAPIAACFGPANRRRRQ